MKNSESEEFGEFLDAVRRRDQQAAAELVRRYLPYIRRVVRLRLTAPHLRRLFDSMDICQSILAEFLGRVSAGAFDLRTPAQLRALLAAMAINKVRAKARKERRYSVRRPHTQDLVSPEPPPDQQLADLDLIAAVRERLSDRERWLLDQRALGRTWVELARQIGAEASALRMQLTRALARVRRDLGMEE